ncbi:probable cysteine--tRNA ligase, mitochondrial isoform X1 [Schistocerca gregaria]|uniref:probable cysteine--tRNA ligase, mitochondrial isoform X1 n=1 Tax=Schistocerca gregaria TaxID=7010 RepID=UPI00211E2AC9|nr:probable cysteine--tRNA ligase, mitochondrial isoform X1 [Schistocerca gregaria]
MKKKSLIKIYGVLRQLRSFSLSATSTKWIEPSGFRTPINVYNSLTKCKVPFITRNKNFVYWYSCGPTVYDSAHIGHASCYVRFDIVRRILANHFGMNVVFVMGITDVDDKIIKMALSQGEDIKTLTRHYENEFFEDMTKLNVQRPSITARVTDYIPHIIAFVENLLTKKHGYITSDGSVYFDVKSLPGYGKLVQVVIDEEEEISNSMEKRSPQDFALWKGSKEYEPFWLAPWGKGRPGWHIECSAIASALLGESIDIHSGGVDLLFPHHENEEAQCCAHHSIPQWTNYWLHSGHLQLKESGKMSKSLKNTISISDFLKEYTSNEFRMFCLLSHYRNSIEFTNSSMEHARGVYRKIEDFLVDCEASINGYKDTGVIDEPEVLKSLEEARISIHSALADDFDTSKTTSIIMNLIHFVNKMLLTKRNDTYVGSQAAGLVACCNFVKNTMESFGVTSSTGQKHSETTVAADVGLVIDSALTFRNTVRELSKSSLKDKDIENHAEKSKANSEALLKACDNFRDDLRSAGIIIKDHNKKSSWVYNKAGVDRTKTTGKM